MKITLEKETSFLYSGTFYSIMINDEQKFTTFDEEEALDIYEKLKIDPYLLDNKKEILKSEEIVVPLLTETKIEEK